MIKLSENFNKLKKNYLFAEIARRTEEYKVKNLGADVIKLGIGDVTLPLCKSVLGAMHEAVDEMGNAATFKGYGPYEGYEYFGDF